MDNTTRITVTAFIPGDMFPPTFNGWRVLHRSEGGRQTPDKMPCVNPSINIDSTPFTRDMQLMSWELMQTANNVMTSKHWRSVWGNWTAFTNGNGYGDASDLRADYVNNIDVTKGLPKLMKAIICSGSFFTGKKVGNEIVMTPGVDGIDANKPLPPLATILEKHWFFYATTARYDATGAWRVSHFPQGQGKPVLIPYILEDVARYPAGWFERWEGYEAPDPLQTY